MAYPTVGYCTDEDIAIRCGDDYATITPKDQKLAYGTDGIILAESRWNLASASVDFAAQGVEPGMACLISGPAPYRSPGELFIVDELSGFGMTLKRKGLDVNVGQPPATDLGLAGVVFTVLTLKPQILAVTYELNKRYGIDDFLSGRRTSDLYDPNEVREAAALMTLVWRYQSMLHAGGENSDQWAAKRAVYDADLGTLLGRTILNWRPVTGEAGGDSSTSPFSTKLSR